MFSFTPGITLVGRRVCYTLMEFTSFLILDGSKDAVLKELVCILCLIDLMGMKKVHGIFMHFSKLYSHFRSLRNDRS